MWIDAKALEADITRFMPLVTIVSGMIPGSAGTTILNFLRAITAPNVVEAVAALVNSMTSATPPAA